MRWIEIESKWKVDVESEKNVDRRYRRLPEISTHTHTCYIYQKDGKRKNRKINQ